jgi:hypothetical protein
MNIGYGYIGGLIGYMCHSENGPGSVISKCYTACDIEGTCTEAGGLTAYIEANSSAEYCYATGKITGTTATWAVFLAAANLRMYLIHIPPALPAGATTTEATRDSAFGLQV